MIWPLTGQAWFLKTTVMLDFWIWAGILYPANAPADKKAAARMMIEAKVFILTHSQKG